MQEGENVHGKETEYMGLTFLLTAGMMVLLFLGIWSATLTLPYKGLAKNFPKDVQERLAPRLDNLPMSGKRVFGCVILVFLLTKTHFFQHYFPETEGCAGWQNFGFNRKEQIRQCIIIPVCCLALAGIFTYIK